MAILKFIGILLEVLLIFNLLIIVHELGHFLAAKWRGLHIEGFGIWFGKPIWKKKIGDVTYSLGCIPAGGFVKLPQLAPMEAIEGQTEVRREQLKPISAIDKIIVAFAGPLFSFMLAVLFAFLVNQIGRPMGEMESSVVVGEVVKGDPADKAGLKAGDEIISVDGIKVTRFVGQAADAIIWRIVRSEGKTIRMVVKRDGQEVTFDVEPRIPDTRAWQRKGTRTIGFVPAVTLRVGKVEEDSPASKADLRPGDFVTAVNGQRIYGAMGISDYISKNPGSDLTLTVERAGGQVLQLPYKPRVPKIAGVFQDSPAEAAGLRMGDRVLTVNGQEFRSAAAITALVRAGGKSPLAFVVERAGSKLDPIKVTPADHEDANFPLIGVSFDDDDGIVPDLYGRGKTIHPGVFEQIETSVGAIFSTIDAVASRKSSISLQHMGGPVMMMNIYYRLFEQPDGWKLALWFSVLLNVNLALLNLLPLPVLDGGHITLAIIEGVSRRRVNLRVLEWIQTACALLIIGFMLFITFFDVQDLFGGQDRQKFRPRTPAAETK